MAALLAVAGRDGRPRGRRGGVVDGLDDGLPPRQRHLQLDALHHAACEEKRGSMNC